MSAQFQLQTVVVTYNRKSVLLNCLDALVRQTLSPTKIHVVDNASTDGTREALAEAGYMDRPEFSYLRLYENVGGAGGFSSGLEVAMAECPEWVWVMDDDGIPEADALERLHSYATRHGYEAICPLHIDIGDHSRLAFPLWLTPRRQVFELTELGKVEFIPDEANLFNGLLIRSSLISRIGLPRKDLFIRGDEVEYAKRMKRAGIRFGTLTSARFYHPSDHHERIRLFGGRLITRDTGDRFKNYYMFRNRAVAFAEDGNAWLLPIDFLRYCYYFMFYQRGNWRGLKLWITATWDGLRGRLGRHPDF